MDSTMQQRRRFQTSDGVLLSVIESGVDRRAPLTIALIPGWCMPAWLWQPQIGALSAHYPVAALDPRGQGESAVPAHGYHFERRAMDILEFLRPHENVLLVGWSLGALEVLEYAHRFGEAKLAGIVLVDSSVGELPAPPPEGHFLDDLRDHRDKALDDFVHAMYARPRPAAEQTALLNDVKRMSLDNSIALLSSGLPREHWKACAHALQKPLLYAVTPQFEAQALNLKKNRPATRIEVFKDAGHALFVDEPARFNALLLNFARDLTRHPA
ncbi:MAG: alpha/beta hydrolase [Betaproteobacteria bacterium]|nr:alpha/beta hydrolase [Betaproteobacteria bacterium]